MSHFPKLEIKKCIAKPVLPLREFIRYVWEVIGAKTFLELQASRPHPYAWPYQLLTIRPHNVVADGNEWLILCRNENYLLWEEGGRVFIQRRK